MLIGLLALMMTGLPCLKGSSIQPDRFFYVITEDTVTSAIARDADRVKFEGLSESKLEAALARLDQPVEVRFVRCKFGKAACKQVTTVGKCLQVLSMEGCSIVDDGRILNALQTFRELRVLQIDGSIPDDQRDTENTAHQLVALSELWTSDWTLLSRCSLPRLTSLSVASVTEPPTSLDLNKVCPMLRTVRLLGDDPSKRVCDLLLTCPLLNTIDLGWHSTDLELPHDHKKGLADLVHRTERVRVRQLPRNADQVYQAIETATLLVRLELIDCDWAPGLIAALQRNTSIRELSVDSAFEPDSMKALIASTRITKFEFAKTTSLKVLNGIAPDRLGAIELQAPTFYCNDPRQLASLANVANLAVLSLVADPEMSQSDRDKVEEELTKLFSQARLRSLDLRWIDWLSEGFLKQLLELRSLSSLALNHLPLLGKDTRSIENLDSLLIVSMRSDDDWGQINRMQYLKSLVICDCTDFGSKAAEVLKSIAGMLNLAISTRTGFSAEVCSVLFGKSGLRRLCLRSQTTIAFPNADVVKACSLEVLALMCPHLSAQDLQTLGVAPKLRYVVLQDGAASDESRMEYLQSRPGVEMVRTQTVSDFDR